MATLFRSPAAQNGQKGSRVLLPHGLPPVNNLSEYTCKNDRVPVAQWLGHRTSNQRSCRLSGGRSGMAPLRPPRARAVAVAVVGAAAPPVCNAPPRLRWPLRSLDWEVSPFLTNWSPWRPTRVAVLAPGMSPFRIEP